MDPLREPRRSVQKADLMEINYPLVLFGIQGSQYTAKVGVRGAGWGVAGCGVRGAERASPGVVLTSTLHSALAQTPTPSSRHHWKLKYAPASRLHAFNEIKDYP